VEEKITITQAQEAAGILSGFCEQFKYCLKCPLDVSSSTLPGGMASPNRCLLLDPPAHWDHKLIEARLREYERRGR